MCEKLEDTEITGMTFHAFVTNNSGVKLAGVELAGITLTHLLQTIRDLGVELAAVEIRGIKLHIFITSKISVSHE